MSAANTIEDIIKLGLLVGQAIEAQGPQFDWKKFLASKEFQQIESDVSKLLTRVTDSEIDTAIATAKAKQDELSKGFNSLADMPLEKLTQWADLSKAIIALSQKRVQAAKNANFFQWIVDNVLPVLLQVGKEVIKLLL